MATVTKPIALDESFHTTEQNPRHIADVLLEGLSHITGRTASEVEYDNTDSGLTADNVQDALDEIAESVPTLPSVDIQAAVDEFETYNGGLLSECIIEIVPVQSGSGDPSPDNVRPITGHTQVVAGDGGKNLFDPTDIILGKRLTNITGTAYNSTQDVIDESNSFVSSLIKVTQGNIVTKNSPNEDAYHRWHIYDGNGICVRYTNDR